MGKWRPSWPFWTNLERQRYLGHAELYMRWGSMMCEQIKAIARLGWPQIVAQELILIVMKHSHGSWSPSAYLSPLHSEGLSHWPPTACWPTVRVHHQQHQSTLDCFVAFQFGLGLPSFPKSYSWFIAHICWLVGCVCACGALLCDQSADRKAACLSTGNDLVTAHHRHRRAFTQ